MLPAEDMVLSVGDVDSALTAMTGIDTSLTSLREDGATMMASSESSSASEVFGMEARWVCADGVLRELDSGFVTAARLDCELLYRRCGKEQRSRLTSDVAPLGRHFAGSMVSPCFTCLHLQIVIRSIVELVVKCTLLRIVECRVANMQPDRSKRV